MGHIYPMHESRKENHKNQLPGTLPLSDDAAEVLGYATDGGNSSYQSDNQTPSDLCISICTKFSRKGVYFNMGETRRS